MATEKQLQTDISELLADITYVNQSNKAEIKQVKHKIQLRIDNEGLAENVADAIIDEVSEQLGRLTAKVKQAERAISSISQKRAKKSARAQVGPQTRDEKPSIKFGAAGFANRKNFLSLQASKNGMPYVWSSSNPEILFSLTLNRNQPLGMQIRLYSLIKPEFSKQLEIYIDGVHTKHWFHADDTYEVGDIIYVVSCNLPSSTNKGKTEIKVVLPATHSPLDLGISSDGRQLGIAINEICFGKIVSGFSHLLRRLRLKT